MTSSRSRFAPHAIVIALLADLIGWNRKLLEVTLEKVRRLELAIAVDISVDPETTSGSGTAKGTTDREGTALTLEKKRR